MLLKDRDEAIKRAKLRYSKESHYKNKCRKYKMNDTAEPEEMKTYTPLKLFKYMWVKRFTAIRYRIF
jgi:hypothetical protein